jgi:F0F1-type ATP synthase membrane subunit b/b'
MAKKILLSLILAAVAGWAVWYYFIREKTVGERIDNATRKVEKTLDNAARKLSH